MGSLSIIVWYLYGCALWTHVRDSVNVKWKANVKRSKHPLNACSGHPWRIHRGVLRGKSKGLLYSLYRVLISIHVVLCNSYLTLSVSINFFVTHLFYMYIVYVSAH